MSLYFRRSSTGYTDAHRTPNRWSRRPIAFHRGIDIEPPAAERFLRDVDYSLPSGASDARTCCWASSMVYFRSTPPTSGRTDRSSGVHRAHHPLPELEVPVERRQVLVDVLDQLMVDRDGTLLASRSFRAWSYIFWLWCRRGLHSPVRSTAFRRPPVIVFLPEESGKNLLPVFPVRDARWRMNVAWSSVTFELSLSVTSGYGKSALEKML